KGCEVSHVRRACAEAQRYLYYTFLLSELQGSGGTRAPKGRRVLAGGLAGIAGAAAGLSRRTEKPVAGQQGSQRPWRHGSVREPGAGGPDEKANHVLDHRGS